MAGISLQGRVAYQPPGQKMYSQHFCDLSLSLFGRLLTMAHDFLGVEGFIHRERGCVLQWLVWAMWGCR